MEDRCMLSVDSGMGAFVCDAVYGPQIRENGIGQYVESVSAEATFDQIDLALDEMLGGECVSIQEEACPYYATVATFEESYVYMSMFSSVTVLTEELNTISSSLDGGGIQTMADKEEPLLLSFWAHENNFNNNNCALIVFIEPLKKIDG